MHDHADPTWRITALAALIAVARRQAKLHAHHVWAELKNTSTSTHNPSAMGAVFRVAAAQGIIRKAEGELAPGELLNAKGKARCHRELQLWDSLVLDRVEAAA